MTGAEVCGAAHFIIKRYIREKKRHQRQTLELLGRTKQKQKDFLVVCGRDGGSQPAKCPGHERCVSEFGGDVTLVGEIC